MGREKGKKDLDHPVRADIEIGAFASAREMRFDEVPETAVEFHGDSPRESVSGTERENLPEEVQPGVTYRNAKVRLRIATRLVDLAERDEETRVHVGPVGSERRGDAVVPEEGESAQDTENE